MNQKVVLKNDSEKAVYCVVSPEETLTQAMEKVFDIKPGYGLSIAVDDRSVTITDYFHGDTLARFELLSITPTDAPLCYHLSPL